MFLNKTPTKNILDLNLNIVSPVPTLSTSMSLSIHHLHLIAMLDVRHHFDVRT